MPPEWALPLVVRVLASARRTSPALVCLPSVRDACRQGAFHRDGMGRPGDYHRPDDLGRRVGLD